MDVIDLFKVDHASRFSFGAPCCGVTWALCMYPHKKDRSDCWWKFLWDRTATKTAKLNFPSNALSTAQIKKAWETPCGIPHAKCKELARIFTKYLTKSNFNFAFDLWGILPVNPTMQNEPDFNSLLIKHPKVSMQDFVLAQMAAKIQLLEAMLLEKFYPALDLRETVIKQNDSTLFNLTDS